MWALPLLRPPPAALPRHSSTRVLVLSPPELASALSVYGRGARLLQTERGGKTEFSRISRAGRQNRSEGRLFPWHDTAAPTPQAAAARSPHGAETWPHIAAPSASRACPGEAPAGVLAAAPLQRGAVPRRRLRSARARRPPPPLRQ